MLSLRRRHISWRDTGFRALVLQGVVLAAVILVVLYLVDNTLDNLARRGIASGFRFLSSEAGFGISQSLIDYSEASSYGRAFWVGLLNTLLVSGLGIVFATVLGFLIGIARLSGNWLVARLAGAYVEIFRNVPLLLQLFFWYFAVLRTLPGPRESLDLGGMVFLNIRGLYAPRPVADPGFSWLIASFVLAIGITAGLFVWARRRRETSGQQFPVFLVSITVLIGLPALTVALWGLPVHWELPQLRGFNYRGGLVMIPELVALFVALSIYTAAFIAETVRAGILSVSHGQTEAAYALGLHRGLTLRLIVIPQALRVIVPPLTNQYLNLTKNSSLAAAIAYPDLVSVFAGTVLNQTGQAIEVIGITMGVYLTISLVISLLMNWYNKHVALVER